MVRTKPLSKILNLSLPAAILASSLLGSVGVSAMPSGATADGQDYWTAADLIALNAEFEAEKNAECLGDQMCEMDFYDSYFRDYTPEKDVLETFNNSRITVTAVNPSKGTLKVVFHDEDGMSRRYGEHQTDTLDKLYLVLLDPSYPDPRTDFSWSRHPAFVDQIEAGEVESNVHVLLAKNSAISGDWIAPNAEVEFAVEDIAALASNASSAIHYSGVIGTWQPYGAFEYQDCLASLNYHDGMECRYVFYTSSRRGYLPFEVSEEVPETPHQSEPEPTIEPEPIAEPNEPTPMIDDTPSSRPARPADASLGSSAPTTGTLADGLVATGNEAPLSQAAPLAESAPGAPKSGEGSTIPWWILAVVGLGLAGFIGWWLLPGAREKRES